VITTLDDTSVIKLDFSVPENFLATLREGLRCVPRRRHSRAHVRGQGREHRTSRVDMNSRAVTVRALLDNDDGARASRHVPERIAGQ
jgi:membrane fusion protein (multidrug efflux system)